MSASTSTSTACACSAATSPASRSTAPRRRSSARSTTASRSARRRASRPRPRARRFAEMNGAELPADRPLELVILPRDDGSFALAWRTHVRTNGKWLQTFLDANTGTVLLQYNDMQTQAAVGTGTGVLGDAKKISSAPAERPVHRRRSAAPALARHLRREGQRDARRKLARRRISGGERHRQRRRQRVDGSCERGRTRQRGLDLRLLLQDVRPPRPERSRRADSFHLASGEPIGPAERVGRRGLDLLPQRVLVRRLRPRRPGNDGVRRRAAERLRPLGYGPARQLLRGRARHRRARADARRDRATRRTSNTGTNRARSTSRSRT